MSMKKLKNVIYLCEIFAKFFNSSRDHFAVSAKPFETEVDDDDDDDADRGDASGTGCVPVLTGVFAGVVVGVCDGVGVGVTNSFSCLITA